MKRPASFVLVLALATAAGCRTTTGTNDSTVQANGNAVGEFKGVAAIEAYLGSRLSMNPTFQLRPFMRGPTDGGFFNDNGMRELLGVFSQVNGVTVFRNGTPNGLNLALWQAIFYRLSAQLATRCDQATDLASPGGALKQSFVDTMRKVCAWPAAEARTDEALQAFWVSVMAFQAPKAEFTAWKDWFAGQETFQQKPGPEVVQAMLYAMFMNPYFLLSQ